MSKQYRVVQVLDGARTVYSTGSLPSAVALATALSDMGKTTLDYCTIEYFDGAAWQKVDPSKPKDVQSQ